MLDVLKCWICILKKIWFLTHSTLINLWRGKTKRKMCKCNAHDICSYIMLSNDYGRVSYKLLLVNTRDRLLRVSHKISHFYLPRRQKLMLIQTHLIFKVFQSFWGFQHRTFFHVIFEDMSVSKTINIFGPILA